MHASKQQYQKKQIVTLQLQRIFDFPARSYYSDVLAQRKQLRQFLSCAKNSFIITGRRFKEQQGPSQKRLVYKQLFDTFKSLLSLVFHLLHSVTHQMIFLLTTILWSKSRQRDVNCVSLLSKYLLLKAMLHEAIFLTTCNVTNVALQVAKKIHV